MSGPRQSSLRLLAPITLAAFAILVVVVIAVSLGGSLDGGDDDSAKQEQVEKKKKTTRRFYTVKDGDNLNLISDKTGVTLVDLQELNPDIDPRTLLAGQRIKLR